MVFSATGIAKSPQLESMSSRHYPYHNFAVCLSFLESSFIFIYQNYRHVFIFRSEIHLISYQLYWGKIGLPMSEYGFLASNFNFFLVERDFSLVVIFLKNISRKEYMVFNQSYKLIFFRIQKTNQIVKDWI